MLDSFFKKYLGYCGAFCTQLELEALFLNCCWYLSIISLMFT